MRVEPEHAEARRRDAEVLHQRACEQRSSTDDRSDVESLRRLGWLQLQEGELEDAIQSLEHALRDRPGDAPTLITLTRAYERRGDVARAYESLRRAMHSLPPDPQLSEHLGALERRMNAVARQ